MAGMGCNAGGVMVGCWAVRVAVWSKARKRSRYFERAARIFRLLSWTLKVCEWGGDGNT